MAKDFKAKQVKSTRLIVSGSGETNASFMIYSSSDATNQVGGIRTQTLQNIGKDVFLFVSGGKSFGGASSRNNVSLFGGDVVVSGSLFTERIVAEVDTTVTGNHHISGSLFIKGKGATQPKILNSLHLTPSSSTKFKTVTVGLAISSSGQSSPAGAIAFDYNQNKKTADALIYEATGSLYMSSSQDLIFVAGGHRKNSAQGSVHDVVHIAFNSTGSAQTLVTFMSGTGGHHTPSSKFEAGIDTNFYVSGSKNSQGKSRRGTAVFGGDVVISGSLKDATGALITAAAATTGSFNVTGSSFVTTSSVSIAGGLGFRKAATGSGEDLYFFVSGSKTNFSNTGKINSVGSKFFRTRKRAMFGGDLTVSGVLYSDTAIEVGHQIYLKDLSQAEDQPKVLAGMQSSKNSDLIIFHSKSSNSGARVLISGKRSSGDGKSFDYVSFTGDGAVAAKRAAIVPKQFFGSDKDDNSFSPQVTILSGGLATSKDRFKSPDAAFYVSGSSGSRRRLLAGASKKPRGTAVFGGDTVVSGTGYVLNDFRVIKGEVFDSTLHSSLANDVAVVSDDDAGFTVSTPNNKRGLVVFKNNGNASAVSFLSLDSSNKLFSLQTTASHNFEIKSQESSGAPNVDFLITGSTANTGKIPGRRVFILSGGYGQHADPAGGGDVNFFVSGSTNSKGKARGGSTAAYSPGTALFGGDVVISGTLYDGAGSVIGSAGSITNISGSTTVGTVTLIDFSKAGILNDHGGGKTALTGTIGEPEDGTYTDGLFQNFTSETTIGHAIDKINEILKALAPSPAGSADNINITNAPGSTALLSFGAGMTTNPDGYTSVSSPGSGLTTIDVNSSFGVMTGSHSLPGLRNGIVNVPTSIQGIVNSDITQTDYNGGSIINHPKYAIGDAEKGTLKLEVNGSIVQTIDLTNSSNGTGVPGSGTANFLDGDGTGFTNVSATASAKTASGTDFDFFKHRTANFIITSNSQRAGHNFARVIHTIGSTDTVTNYIDWVYDISGSDSNSPISATDSSFTATGLGNRFDLSGVKYAVSVTGDYKSRINNFYNSVYAANEINVGTTNCTVLSKSPTNVPSLNTSNDSHQSFIHFTSSVRTSVASSLGGTLATNLSLAHPTKTGLTNAAPVTSGRFLIFTASSDNFSKNKFERFFTEERRIKSGSYDAVATFDNPSSYQWDSSLHMSGANAGHEDGLQFYDGNLKSPKNTLSAGSVGDFRSAADGQVFFGTGHTYNSQPNYSSVSGLRTFYRSVYNDSGSPIRDFKIAITGSSTTIVDDSASLGSGNIKVFAKLPGSTKNKKITVDNNSNTMDLAGATITVNDGSSSRVVTFAFSDSPDNNINTMSDGGGDTDAFATRIATAINGSSGGAVNVTATANGSDVELTHDSGGTVTVSMAQNSASRDPADSFTIADFGSATGFGWLDLGSAFAYGTGSNRAGGRANDTLQSSISGTPAINYFTFGTESVAAGKPFVVKIEADASWSGLISDINFILPGVSGVPVVSPNLSALNSTTSGGVEAKLSFGASHAITGYQNVTGSGPSFEGSVDSNATYTITGNRFGVFRNTNLVGDLNHSISANGNSHPAKSFGGGNAHLGQLKLEVNDDIVQTVELENFSLSSDSDPHNKLMNSGTGFNLLSIPTNAKGTSGLVRDYRKWWRTGSFTVASSIQQSGRNYARVIHSLTGTDYVTNYVEWINDPDSDILTLSEAEFSRFGDDVLYYQSGVKFFINPTGSFKVRAQNAYNAVYSPASDAIQVLNTSQLNAASNIFVTGSGITDTHVASNQMALPAITNGVSDSHSRDIFVTASVQFNESYSVPGTSPIGGTTEHAASAEMRIKHPLDDALGYKTTATTFVGGSSSKKFLVLSASLTDGSNGTTNAHTAEHFVREDFRLKAGNYTAQNQISVSSKWNSINSINDASLSDYVDGMLTYNGFAVSPKNSKLPGITPGNFTSYFDNSSSDIIGPDSNVNYSSLVTSAPRTYYRYFENNTTNNVFDVDVIIRGDATIIGKDGVHSGSMGSDKKITVEGKIPGKTGWLDLGRPTAGSGNISDGDGGLNGDLTQTITTEGVTNNLTFNGQVVNGTAGTPDKIVLRISCHSGWTGYISRIEIVY